jgi:ribosomal protein S8
MPDFSVDDIEIEPHEFVSSCNSRELRELVEALKDEGYIIMGKKEKDSNHDEFETALEILQQSKMMLSSEEEEMIIKLGEKFRYIVLK